MLTLVEGCSLLVNVSEGPTTVNKRTMFWTSQKMFNYTKSSLARAVCHFC